LKQNPLFSKPVRIFGSVGQIVFGSFHPEMAYSWMELLAVSPADSGISQHLVFNVICQKLIADG
jgi:hypothetical protein